MNMNYLISVINLYLSKEKNNYLIIELSNTDDNIKISLSYSNSYNDKTYIKINKNLFYKDINLLINTIQSNVVINEEKIDENVYSVIFKNNRTIKFINFSNDDIISIRNNFNFTNYEHLYDLKLTSSEDKNYDEIYKENKNTNLKFSFGFGSFITIFLTSIWFLDIFMIALWVFKILK